MSGGKVVVHRAMSLDGFIDGPEHEMDWIFEHTAPAEGAEEVMHTTGAMLAGRHPETSAAYGGAWSGAELGLTPKARTAGDNPDAVFLSGDIAEAVATGLVATGGKNFEVLGTDVTVQCLARGLVDEIGAPQDPCSRRCAAENVSQNYNQCCLEFSETPAATRTRNRRDTPAQPSTSRPPV